MRGSLELLAGKVSGLTMARTRINDPEFWKWVDYMTCFQETRLVVVDAPWDTMRDALDFECFLLGAAWLTFNPSQTYISHSTLIGQVASMWPTHEKDVSACLFRWWSKTESGPEIYSTRPHAVTAFCKMLDREHLNHFIWGAKYRLSQIKIRPSETWAYAPAIVLGCMKEPPDGTQLTELCDILLPARKLSKYKGRPQEFVNERTWIRVLGGKDPLTDGAKVKFFARYGNIVGGLSVPWVQEHYRYLLTYQMPVLSHAYVHRLSLQAIKDKIKALRKNNGDFAWLTLLWSSYSILSDEDDEILALLPTILDVNWASAVADLLEKRSIVLKIEANPPKTFRKVPTILVGHHKLPLL